MPSHFCSLKCTFRWEQQDIISADVESDFHFADSFLIPFIGVFAIAVFPGSLNRSHEKVCVVPGLQLFNVQGGKLYLERHQRLRPRFQTCKVCVRSGQLEVPLSLRKRHRILQCYTKMTFSATWLLLLVDVSKGDLKNEWKCCYREVSQAPISCIMCKYTRTHLR